MNAFSHPSLRARDSEERGLLLDAIEFRDYKEESLIEYLRDLLKRPAQS